MGFMKLAGHSVEIETCYTTHRPQLTLPCLAGDGSHRERGRIIVLVGKDGALSDATSGEAMSAVPADDLRGWGDLDGPSYAVGLAGPNQPTVNVPASLIDAAREWGRTH